MSEHFAERLARIRFGHPPTIRIRGLAIGVDVEREEYASKVQDRCREEGLLISTEGSTLLLLPALDVDRAIADRGLDILAACV